MSISSDGTFSFKINGKDLSRGLRPNTRMPRNEKYLVECSGVVGKDGILSAITQLSKEDLSMSFSFPYPQLFEFTMVTIVCTGTSVYELVSGSLVLKATVAEYSTWTAVDFYDYVYLSNGESVVVREAGAFTYSVSTTLPPAYSICNFKGQVIIGTTQTV